MHAHLPPHLQHQCDAIGAVHEPHVRAVLTHEDAAVHSNTLQRVRVHGDGRDAVLEQRTERKLAPRRQRVKGVWMRGRAARPCVRAFAVSVARTAITAAGTLFNNTSHDSNAALSRSAATAASKLADAVDGGAAIFFRSHSANGTCNFRPVCQRVQHAHNSHTRARTYIHTQAHLTHHARAVG